MAEPRAIQTVTYTNQAERAGWLWRMIVTEESYSIENNQSYVKVSTYLGRESSQSYFGGTASVNITCNGESRSTSKTFSYPTYVNGGGWILFQEENFTISHNSDGSKSINVESSFSTSDFSPYSGWVAGGLDLSTIPRASSVSVSNYDLGQNIGIVIGKKVSSFTSTLTFKIGEKYGNIVEKTNDSNYIWVMSDSLIKEIKASNPNTKNISATIYCDTYNGDSKIGTTQNATFTLTIIDLPIIENIVIEEQNTMVSGLTTDIVKYVSKPKITVNAKAPYGTYSKNLLNIILKSQTINGITITVNEDKSITLNGTSTAEFYPILSNKFKLENKEYTLSTVAEMQDSKIKMVVRQSTQNVQITQLYSGNSITFTNTYLDDVYVYLVIRANQTFNNFTIYPMLEEGTEKTEYESYKSGIKKYYFLKGGNTYNSDTNEYILENIQDSFMDGDILKTRFTVYVEDNRGNVSLETIEDRNFIDYVNLAINTTDIKLARLTNVSNTVKLSLTGFVYNGLIGDSQNTVSVKYRYKLQSDSEWSSYTTIPTTLEGNTFKITDLELAGEFDYRENYDFEFYATDLLQTTPASTFLLSSTEYVYLFHKNGADFKTLTEGKKRVALKEDIIVDIGSNSNGTYIKYANGIMICTKIVSGNTGTYFNLWANGIYYFDISNGDWAAEFIEIYSVQATNTNNQLWCNIGNYTMTSAGITSLIRPDDGGVKGHNYSVHLTAIGKWK